MALVVPERVTASRRKLPLTPLAPVPARRKVVGVEKLSEIEDEFWRQSAAAMVPTAGARDCAPVSEVA